ncbi:MAG: hypothetical protein ABIO80_06295 [Sphingomicrobium sp.]
MISMRAIAGASTLLAALAGSGCGQSQQPPAKPIKVRSAEQNQLHQLDALNLAIALKRAIYDAGYTCKRVTDAGFVADYQNLEVWQAHCEYDRRSAVDWAIFAGPDGTAQVRDCNDIPGTGLPTCAIKQRPKGSFNS